MLADWCIMAIAGPDQDPPEPTRETGIMSKARARERKKARLAKLQAAKHSPHESHESGADPTPAELIEEKSHPGKFDAKSAQGGGMRNAGGKNIPNLAASSRGSARSR
jgi:hypothetical protein